MPGFGRLANHRLHLTSGGGLTADLRPRSPAAGEAERYDKERLLAEGRILWCRSALRCRAARVTPQCEAVAAWYPPGASENTAEVEQQLVSTARALLGEHADVFLSGCELIESSHPFGRPHYYLSLLGTHPDHSGRGLGMGLLRESLALIDAEGMPAYLESTNPGNNSRYEKVGFSRIGGYALPNGPPGST